MAVQVDLKDPLLTYTKPCYIPGPGIFRTGGIFKTCENMTRNIQNSAIVRTVYSGIIQPYSKPCAMVAYMQKPDMFHIL